MNKYIEEYEKMSLYDFADELDEPLFTIKQNLTQAIYLHYAKERDENFKLQQENKELQKENELLKRNCNIGNENLDFYRQQYKELHNKIDKAIEILKEHFVEEYIRSCDTSDGVGRYEIDTEHWTYKVYEQLKDSDVDE